MHRPPPISTLFPYTTLFRSDRQRGLLREYDAGVPLPESAGYQAWAGRCPGGAGHDARLYHRPPCCPGPVPRWVAPDRHRSADGAVGTVGGPAQPPPRSDHTGACSSARPQPLTRESSWVVQWDQSLASFDLPLQLLDLAWTSECRPATICLTRPRPLK